MTKKKSVRSRSTIKLKSLKGKIGQVPGTMEYTGIKSDKPLYIELFDYNSDQIAHHKLKSVEEVFNHTKSGDILWLNINGLNHVESIESVGKQYDLHPLVLEDIVNITQRPKLDEYENYLFVIVKMLYHDRDERLVVEQLSFILGENYLISFQESEGDVLDPVRKRLIQTKGRLRFIHADYLLYALIDAIIDHYYSIIESLGDKLEDLENQLFNGSQKDDIVHKIQELKREILRVRRAVVPLRELINKIEKYDYKLITDHSKLFYRDLYDHIVQITEQIDIYREMIWSLMDMHMNTLSIKMNQVMKVLTIMASIFIPLTFLAGIYGMNFKYIPELDYHYGYYVFWVVMILLVVLMLFLFKRKKWL
ncbi:MAG: magnesium/cobalt transporter CorA [Flavobacteriaceae bacterium]|nr:magnesium/cobalt transporter CorA [Flavobacteriaceae bacterium]